MVNSSDIQDQSPTAGRIAVGVIGTVGMVLNAATLAVLLTNFTRIFSKVEACLVTNLCVADLATNISALLWGLYPIVSSARDVTVGLHCAQWATVAASFLTLSCMAVERLVVVVNPIKARRMLTRSFALVCCAVIWVISIVTGSMLAVDPPIAQCTMIVMFEISLIATIGCYARIYFTVNKLNGDGFRAAARYNTKNADLKLEVEENEPALHHRVAIRQESRITNLVFLLIIILTITVLPYMVLIHVVITHRLSCPNCEWTPAMITALDVLFPVEMLNFVLNPLVYAWRLPKFRQASKRTVNLIICGKKWKANSKAIARGDRSYSSSSDSLANSPATIFTGGNTEGDALNNNRHL